LLIRAILVLNLAPKKKQLP
jgi:hypothetical protein